MVKHLHVRRCQSGEFPLNPLPINDVAYIWTYFLLVILEAPENLAPPVPSALPVLYRGNGWNSSGYRASKAFGDDLEDAIL